MKITLAEQKGSAGLMNHLVVSPRFVNAVLRGMRARLTIKP
jgi:hypothetical protein